MSDQLLDSPAKYPFSFSALFDKTWRTITEAAFRAGWAPVSRLAEAAVISLLERITLGHLRVLTLSHIYEFPIPEKRSSLTSKDCDLKAELRVVNDAFWVRLCTMGGLGFAEAYMYGDVECDDLVSLFLIFLRNQEKLVDIDSRLSYLFTLPQKLTSHRFLNTIGNSRSNISAHYDISNEMFSGFLSEDMTYSCAIFDNLDGDLKPGLHLGQYSGGHGLRRLNSDITTEPDHPNSTESKTINGNTTNPPPGYDTQDELYTAQIRKLDHIIRKAHIHPGHRILEIGSGWGSLAIRLAQTTPRTHIDTLTLSVQQQTLARERIAKAGLSDRINVHLMDYRNMPGEWEGAFDRVVSVEMIEAVGAEFLETYWKVVDWALDKKSGVGVVQVITIPEARFDRYVQEADFIRKWYVQFHFEHIQDAHKQQHPPLLVFPGGLLPTLTLLLKSMEAGSGGRLIVDSVSNIGPHYARTLREWRRRFVDRFYSVIMPALEREYPDAMCGPNGHKEVEVFKRKWISVTVKLDSRPGPWGIISSLSFVTAIRRMDAMSTNKSDHWIHSS